MKIEIVYRDGRKEIIKNVERFSIAEEQTANQKCSTFKEAQIIAKGKLFEVNHLKIDRTAFSKPMSDCRQEETRQIIQEAFAEVDKHPGKYVSPFYTLIPEKRWDGYKMVKKLEEYAKLLGGQTADWVEQALEWAQRICNGESWEAVCNKPDTAKWYRLVVWKDGYGRAVGSSRYFYSHNPASEVYSKEFGSNDMIRHTVPLLVLK